MRTLILLPAMIVAALFTTPAARADSFAAAVGYNDDGSEAAFSWCRRSTLKGTKTCALNSCESDNSDNNGDCEFTVWCEPGSWSGVLSIIISDGGVKHVAVCEKSSRKLALKALKHECKAAHRADPSNFKSCVVENLQAPDAQSSDTNVVTWKYRNGDIRAVN